MERLIKILALINNTYLISEIVEVGADVGQPDCKITNPFVLRSDKTMEPFLCDYTAQDTFMDFSVEGLGELIATGLNSHRVVSFG